MTEPGFKERAARALATSERGVDDDWRLYLEDAEIVLKAITDTLAAGKSVHIPGTGLLTPKLRRRWIERPNGGRRGQAIEERYAALQHGAVLWKGEPYEA